MLDLRSMAVAAAIAFLTGGALAMKYENAVWTAKVADQKQEAAQELAEATERARKAEALNDKLKTDLEKNDAQKKAAVESVLRDNRRLVRELGGLRDPGRRPSGDGAMPSGAESSGSCPGGTAGSRLSDEASEFLLEFAASCDRAATYAQTCHAWATRAAVKVAQ